jgi:hypothetical protein
MVGRQIRQLANNTQRLAGFPEEPHYWRRQGIEMGRLNPENLHPKGADVL